jgi:hypothetical protein
MPIRSTQHKFTSGELDPLLLGRTDIDRYYGAAETMTNVRLLPQGGFKRDDGLEYVDRAHRQVTRESSPTITTPNGGTGANANDDSTSTELVTTTNISTTDPYVVVHYDLGSQKDLAFIDVVGAKLTSATNSTEFFIQVSTDDSSWTSLGDAIDMSTSDVTRRRRVRGTYRYVRFARIGSTDLGTDKVTLDEFHVWVEGSSVSTSRLIPFEFNVTQSYMLLVSDRNLSIYRDGVLQIDVRATQITESIISEIKYTQSADTMIFVQEDTTPFKMVRQGADDKWLISDITFDKIPLYDFDPASSTPSGTLTPSATSGVVTLTASTGTPFSSASVNQYVQGGGGSARIIEYVSGTEVTAVTEIPFYTTNAIANGDWDYVTGFEDVWSSSRGYPKTVTFHRGRLYFGGSKERPQTIWGSKIDLFFDFDLGSLDDSDGIDATLDTDQINEIINLKSTNGNLLVFTSGAEFSIPQTADTNITPSNFSLVPVSQYGSESGFNVGVISGNNVFIQRGGRSLIRYTYDTLQQVSSSENVSLLASHLIDSPADFVVRKSTSTEESNLILFVNGSGELIEGTILFEQNVIGFTKRQSTGASGLIKNVGVDISTIYLMVERTVNGVTNRYFEKMNDSALLDSSTIVTSGLPTSTFTGLDHLEGETVKIIADGSVLGDEIVSSGSVTIDRDAETSVEIGLDMSPTITTLPIEVADLGSRIGLRKRISEVVLRVKDTGDFTINGEPVSFRSFGESGDGSPLDAAPPTFTGDKKVKGLMGWSERQQITISQSEPADLQVLSVTLSVNI